MWVVDDETGKIVYVGRTYGECNNICHIHDFQQEKAENPTKWRVRFESDLTKAVVR